MGPGKQVASQMGEGFEFLSANQVYGKHSKKSQAGIGAENCST